MRDSLYSDWLLKDRDALDGLDIWDEEESNKIWEKLRKELNEARPNFNYKIPVCECGAEKVYGYATGHSNWCPKGD